MHFAEVSLVPRAAEASMSAEVVSLEERRERIRLECAPQFFPPVILPAGLYELAYVGHRVQQQFHRGVLALYFVVVDRWPKETIIVARYYQVTREKGGRWRPAKHGALVTEFRRVFR